MYINLCAMPAMAYGVVFIRKQMGNQDCRQVVGILIEKFQLMKIFGGCQYLATMLAEPLMKQSLTVVSTMDIIVREVTRGILYQLLFGKVNIMITSTVPPILIRILGKLLNHNSLRHNYE